MLPVTVRYLDPLLLWNPQPWSEVVSADERAVNKHIDPEILELYVLGRAPVVDVHWIESHLSDCAICAGLLLETEAYVAAMRWGLAVVSGVRAVHLCQEGGCVSLRVQQTGGRWLGTVNGPDLGSGRLCESRTEAVAFVTSTFHELFPGHECCGCQAFETERGCYNAYTLK